MVSIGAAMFFFALLVLTKAGYGAVPTVMKVIGGMFMVCGIPGAFVCLSRARRKGQQIVDDLPR